jgi:hypothetical protein
MKKGDIFGNIFVIDIKERGSLQISNVNVTILHISKINIARWRLFKVLILYFL